MDKNEQERNEHFKGFAKLLYDEIGALNTLDIQRSGDYTSFDVAAKKLIAQYAYDLAMHIVQECHKWDMGYMEVPDLMAEMPDLIEWPPD